MCPPAGFRTGDERGLRSSSPQSGLIYSSFTLTSASCLSIASGPFFFFFPQKQIKPQLFICSTKSAHWAVCGSAGLGVAEDLLAVKQKGSCFISSQEFPTWASIFLLKKKKKGEDLIPWSLKLRKKKKHTVFFIQGGDIFLAGGHRLSQKEKLKCCSTPVSNLILGIPFEESWVSAQEVWNSGQDSLTSGI